MDLVPAPETRVRFRRHLRPEIVEGEAVYLFSERGVTALQGAAVELLAPLLDGTRSLTEVIRDLPAELPAERVSGLVARLTAAGLLGSQDADDDGDEAALAYWDAAGLDPVDAVAGTTAATVRLVTVGDCRSDDVAEALRRAGLAITEDEGDLSVVVCADYLDPALAEVDRTHRRAGKPWLIVKPTGTQVWVGPVFTPAEGACWHCLATRLSANRPAEARVSAKHGRPGPAPRPAVGVAPVAATAAGVAATEATKWLAGYRHPGQQEVWVYDSLSLRVAHHSVRPRPQCSACGDPELVAAQANRPVVISPRPKRSVHGGGHRSATPGEVLDRYRHLISPVTGVVKDIRRDTRGPQLFNSYRSGSNQALGARTFDGLCSALRQDNGGKGVTPIDAEVGALCEALERHSGAFHGDEARIRGSYTELRDQAIHPDRCQLLDPRQYENRKAWNAAHSAFQHVVDPFDDNASIDWTPVWSMTAERHRLLPTGMLYYGAPSPSSVRADSNGCAAGSSLEDAILQGLLEIVERDAVAVWWYNRLRMPAVDLDSVGDPWIAEVRETYRGLGRELWVLDLTADLGIPVMAAVSRRVGGDREDITFGFGAHLDPAVALRRALTELNQVMPAILDAGPAQLSASKDIDLRTWLATATVADQPYLLPDPSAPAIRHAYAPEPDLSADIRAVQRRLAAEGLELLVLDQTRPDIGLPVVRVIVPGMRHFWSRFAPGRLYEVPLHTGRRTAATAYEDLNPIPMFM
jgi:ribosomal protein S12 methylthiotransferase accessory factor